MNQLKNKEVDKNIDTVNFNELIRTVGQKLILDYKNNVLKSGINGPYDDLETEVRDLSHLCIITAIEIIKFKRIEYLSLLHKMGDYLLSLQEKNSLYIMRQKKNKDICNGVIGHAWVNEAFIYLYKAAKEKKYLDAAIKIADKHKFQKSLGIWERPKMELFDTSIDYTFNHQLWYAATLMELNQIIMSLEYEEQINIFLDKLKKNFSISKNGRIAHSIYRHSNFLSRIKQVIKKYVEKIKEKTDRKSLAYKEEGYHIFNMMAFARIYNIRKHYFFESDKFKRAMEYTNSQKMLEGLENEKIEKDSSLSNKNILEKEKKVNIYGYPYNVPGFEIFYINQVFNKQINKNLLQECMSKQINFTFDYKTKMFGKNCHDKITINYRVYEYYRYLEII